MRKIILATVLALAATAHAPAGDMQFGLTGPPGPTPTPQTMRAAGAPTTEGAATTEEADILTETLLSLVESVLALL